MEVTDASPSYTLRMIQLQRLEGFYWVAKTEGYARAARSFPYPITQPGVHQQVSRLEAELETRLFERVGKDRVRLTPAGQVLYDFVAPFYEQLTPVEKAVRSGMQPETLHVDASGHLLRYLLPPWLRRIQGRHPALQLEVTETRMPLLERVRDGQTDLLVDHLPRVPRDLASRRIGTAKAFLVLSATDARARTGPATVKLESLADETFIAYGTDRQARELQLQALASHGVRPRVIHSADSAESILGLVAGGLGYSLVPSVLPHGPREPGLFTQALTRPAAEFAIYAVWRKHAPPSGPVQQAMRLAPYPGS